ncbi:GTP-binding protein [Pseudactinotalea terrae]|uniref:GTP-binding protein n=1 Tax=Pseudactinotalea terrae TaxID=1743262 RepID=UPI001391C6B5|nr:GTP-binding protein [Pseudactinotalea terrae]
MSHEVGPELRARVEQIREALDRGADRFEPAVADRARADLDRVLERLDLGVDHSVVALVGGTGSGKSSTFNALTTLQFADVGVIRPTTSQATACVWGPQAEKLLDFLQVAKERRILRESALTGSDEADLHGLVLLDLPDHDSVATGHAELVNRLLPLIDLLIWVVDPQKYADNALHEGYLRELQDRHEAMLVVVNQVDTLTDAGKEAVRVDVGRLLAEDGIGDVPVMLASARTGDGIAAVRDHLRSVLRTESIAARTARDEIAAIARRIGEGLGESEPAIPAPTETADSLAEAAGVPAVAQAIETAVVSPTPVVLSSVQRPARSRIDAIRESWLATTTAGLPARWRAAVVSSVASAGDFFEHASAALEGVPQPSSRDQSAARQRLLGLIALIVGIVAVVVGAILLTQSTGLGIGVAAGGVLVTIVGLVLVLAARSRRRRTAAERAERYRRDVTDAVARVVKNDLDEPATAILADHQSVRSSVSGS